MSSIDTSSWKEFKLDELFEKIKTEKISGKANDFPTCRTDEYTIPLLTAGADNQGLARYAKKNQCPTILKNVISISANGANTGVTFYQNNEFAVLQDAYAIKLKDIEIPNEQVGLFLASCISKILHGNFSWTYKAGWERIKDLSIKLPVKESEKIDWDYMQERIAELEQERIAELEQYLIATGLNDYELTDEDKEILATKLTDGGALQSSIFGNGCLKEARSFKLDELFEKIQTKKIYGKANDFPVCKSVEYTIPLLTAGADNQGFARYGKRNQCPNILKNVISISANGANTGVTFYQSDEFAVLQDAYAIKLKGMEIPNKQVGLFLAACINKILHGNFSWTFKAGWERIKEMSINLPIKQSGEIDWEYMEKYIKATEKVVIRDVVDWKDEMIKKTKEVVEEVNMLKNKEYVSMSDVINHDQNLKKLEDDIESTLKKQGVSIDGKTHLNIQRMTVLVGNYCLDNTSDINCLVEALSKIEQVKFNEDQSHAEIIFKTNSAICKKDGLDTFFAIVFDAADRDEEPSLKYQTKVFKVRIGMNMEYVLMDEIKDINTLLFPGTLKVAGYEL